MAVIRITQSVGLGGANNLNDVKTVQTALNSLLSLIAPTRKLTVDGRLGSRPGNKLDIYGRSPEVKTS